jgi:hypothetical protein
MPRGFQQPLRIWDEALRHKPSQPESAPQGAKNQSEANDQPIMESHDNLCPGFLPAQRRQFYLIYPVKISRPC